MTRPRVAALGGQREVPEPDSIAAGYLELALRLDQRVPGLVDGYYGPAEIKARVDLEQLRSPERLAADAVDLTGRLEAEVEDLTRRGWLRLQLRALETQARLLAGESLGYLERVDRLFGTTPHRRGEAALTDLAGSLDSLVPGTAPLLDRLAAWDARWVVPAERVAAIADWLIDSLRDRAAPVFGLPDGESIRLSLVSGQPWSGYNWYDGGLQSRVDLNVDLPIRGPDLLATLAHETYAGHHLEHAWKEAEQVERLGRLEASAMLINAPECLISEGLAEIGRSLILDPAAEAELLAELAIRAGLADAAGPGADLHELAETAVAIGAVRSRLRGSDVDAALMLNAESRSRDEVAAWLERFALLAPERAARKLEFIGHPTWSTYAFVYADGAQLLSAWLAAVPSAERVGRYRRLLVEPISLPVIFAETGPPVGSAGLDGASALRP